MSSIEIVIQNPQKADIFAGIFQHVRLFTDHINVMFEKERMYIQSMDSSRVSIFEVFIPASWFDRYNHNMPGGVTIGLNSSMLFKMLNTRDKSQEMKLIYNEEDDDKLFLQFSCENKAIYDKQFEMPLLELDYEIMNIPESESQAEFSIPSANFASIINQLKLFGDSLDIECTEETIQLTSVSIDSGKMMVNIGIDDLTSFSINEGEVMNLSFSLNNLHNICMYSKIAKEMDIHLTYNFPLRIVYWLDESSVDTENRAKLVFYLAPKISDD